jgi:hypothetical protein
MTGDVGDGRSRGSGGFLYEGHSLCVVLVALGGEATRCSRTMNTVAGLDNDKKGPNDGVLDRTLSIPSPGKV